MQYRLLTSDNKEECRELLLKNSANVPPSLLTLPFLFDDMYLVFGGFRDSNKLVAAVFVEFSMYDRSYIVRFATKTAITPLTIFAQLMERVWKYAESIAYYRFYVTYSKHVGAWERVVSNQRYIGFVEEVIPVKTNSSFVLYWKTIQFRQLYPSTLTIKLYALKDEFRETRI